MEDLYEKHPDLKEFGTKCKKYTRLDEKGNILEFWERDADGNWQDNSEVARLMQELEALKKKAAREKSLKGEK